MNFIRGNDFGKDKFINTRVHQESTVCCAQTNRRLELSFSTVFRKKKSVPYKINKIAAFEFENLAFSA